MDIKTELLMERKEREWLCLPQMTTLLFLISATLCRGVRVGGGGSQRLLALGWLWPFWFKSSVCPTQECFSVLPHWWGSQWGVPLNPDRSSSLICSLQCRRQLLSSLRVWEKVCYVWWICCHMNLQVCLYYLFLFIIKKDQLSRIIGPQAKWIIMTL